MTNKINETITHNLSFNPTILTDILGNKIIELDSIVFSELIKNSKDSHAKSLTIDFSDHTNKIIFKDNGNGMNLDDIKNNWLVVANNNKTNNYDSLGGKGIGRFSAFKICNKITVITKKHNCPEFTFSITFQDLNQLDKAENLKINIIKNNSSKYFVNNSTGTKLILEDMKEISLNEVQNDLENLILEDSKTSKNFSINFIYPKKYIPLNIMKPKVAKQLAPFKCKVSFENNKLIDYNFSAELNNNTYKTINSSNSLSLEIEKLPSNLSLGIVNIQLNLFLLDNNFVKHYSINKKKLQEEFLNFYYGISIYRNDFKIYGFGKNDWLDLNERRIDEPTKRVNNKQIYGFIELDKLSLNLLEEKTSREGFIRSKYFSYLKNAIMLIIKQFEADMLPCRKLLTGTNKTWIFDSDETESDKQDNIESKKDSKSDSDIQNDSESKKDSKSNSDIQNDSESKKDSKSNSDIQNDSESKKDSKSNSDIQNDSESKKDSKSNPDIQNDSESKKDSKSNSDIQNDSESKKDSRSNSNKQKEDSKINNKNNSSKSSTPKFDNSIIIDSSFNISKNAPEKIKKVIYELQKIKNFENAQALLLRCLIDISTKHIADVLSLTIAEKDLRSDILTVLNYLSNNKEIDAKYIERIRTSIKKDHIINYFNGIAHLPDYRPDYDTIKSIWDIFEPYIKFCAEKNS